MCRAFRWLLLVQCAKLAAGFLPPVILSSQATLVSANAATRHLSGNFASGLAMREDTSSVSRRDILGGSASAFLAVTSAMPVYAKRPACGDVDSCREMGDKKFYEAEKEKGKIVRLGNGVSYREIRPGTGDIAAKPGDVVEISFQVLKGNGYYMYSVGYGKEPGLQDLGETYRLTLGNHDVPVAVEMALQGAKKGAVLKVEMPPAVGFESSAWQPAAATFEGKQRIVPQRVEG